MTPATRSNPQTAPIDPVSSPEAYRRELLSWLGDDDPAVVQQATVERLREIVQVAGDRLRVRPEPREWSVIECVGHLVDSELVAGARMRWILAEDEPDIVGYDQDRWVDGLRHRDDDPQDLIALFECCAARTCDFGRRRRRPIANASGATASAGRKATGSWSSSRPATTASTSPRPNGHSPRPAAAEVRRPAGSGPSRRVTPRSRRSPPG